MRSARVNSWMATTFLATTLALYFGLHSVAMASAAALALGSMVEFVHARRARRAALTPWSR